MLLAYASVFLIGQFGLTSLIFCPQACQIDLDFALPVADPSRSSFPSTHSAWAFGAAAAICMQHRKAGVAAFIAAALIAFSRLYTFLHFSADVLAGIALGVMPGALAHWIAGRLWKGRCTGRALF